MVRVLRVLLVCALIAATAAGGATAVRPAGAAGTGAPPAPPKFRLLVRTGQQAPGGGTFNELSDPTINNVGDVVFGAVVTSGAQIRETLYFMTGGTPRPFVSTGSAAPTGGAFASFSDLLLNDRGTVGFLARTTDRLAQQGFYLFRAGRVVPIVSVGQPAPTGGIFVDFANPTINNQDLIAFVGRTGSGEGIFTYSEGSTTPVLMSGQAAPTGGAFEFFLDGSPALNDRGQMAFVASTTVRHMQGVYVLVDGRPVPLVTTDDDSPSGGRFTEFGSVVLTNAGTVAFIGRTADGKIPEALYVTGRADLIPFAVSGQDVGGTALTKFANVAINAREEVVFQLSLPIIAQATYLATRAGVRTIAQLGDAAPGGGRFTAFSTPVLNDAGQVAFIAETDDGRHGLYVEALR